MENKRSQVLHCAFVSLMGLCPPALAARPLSTDDAPILDPGQCQLETWVQRDPAHTQYWAVPACNFTGSWELAAGAAHVRGRSGGAEKNLAVLQAKTELLAPQDSGWRLGMSVADQFEPSRGLAGDWTVNLPLTVDLHGDRLQWHTNLGWSSLRHGRSAATWGLALEAAVGERMALTAESYGTRGSGAWRQLGARYSLAPGRADLDIAWGERSGSGKRDRYCAAGLTVYANLP